MDALVKGFFEDIHLLLSVITMIIVLFALVNLIDQFLYFLPPIGHSQISLGLTVGSMSTLAPNRRFEIVSLSFTSLIAGTLATLMTGAVVQIIL